MKQNFKEGELVRVALARPSYSHNGLLGIICGTSKKPDGPRFLVHLQSGRKHWFFDHEIRKAAG